MAKTRRSEPATEKAPPPPRMKGMGLGAGALVAAAAAALTALVAVLLATAGGKDADRTADALASALLAALTAPDPYSWSKDYRTFDANWAWVRSHFDESVQRDFPKLTPEKYKLQAGIDHQTRETNRRRLSAAASEIVPPGGGSVVAGLQIQFKPATKLGDVTAGVGLPTGTVLTARRVLPGSIGVATIAHPEVAGGARVYFRPYRTDRNEEAGTAYAILAERALASGGDPGVWLILAPVLVGAAAGIGVAFANRASAGIRALARDLEAIGRGKLDLRVTTSGSGEVGFAQRAAERMAKNLQLIQTTGSGDLDEAVQKELSLAAQIHQSLRPQDPPRVPGYELETLFRPGRDIGGDYFDYVELDENRVAIVIADCSETLRGVAAAMVMAMTRAYLRSAVDPATGPAEWLKATNRRLARDLKAGMAVTAQVAVLDAASGEVTLASAGHRPTVLWRQGKTAQLNPNGVALGLDIGPVFDKTLETKSITLQKNDRLVFYTDGVVAAKNEAGEAYGEERFLESVRKQGGMNSAAFVNFVAGAVDAFCGGADKSDDVTISTVKRLK